MKPSHGHPIKRSQRAGLDACTTSLDLASLGEHVCSMAVGADGTRFVCTTSALFVFTKCGFQTTLAGHKTKKGFQDGDGTDARFNSPYGIAVDGDGNVFVADSENHALRKVSRGGAVTTLAGSGQAGFADGVGTAARFHEPWGIAISAQGTLLVADYMNHCIRQVDPVDGTVTTLVGKGTEKGLKDGQGTSSRFNEPCGVALDGAGNLIVADLGNDCIRKVTTAYVVTTLAGCAGQEGFADGEAAAARFHGPQAVAVDGNSNILVADQHNNRIRMISGANARVTTVAGSTDAGDIDGTSARFNRPIALVLDQGGRLLVKELNVRRLRVVEASLMPPHHLSAKPIKNALHDALQDYGKLLEDTALADVTFVVDGHRFPAHRCVLAARSPYFSALFKPGLREGAGAVASEDIVFHEVGDGAFRVLLRFLYTHTLPDDKDCGEGLEVGEMARVADRFQAAELYDHCVQRFGEGLEVRNVVERLVVAHDSSLPALQQVAINYFRSNAVLFQVGVLLVLFSTQFVLCTGVRLVCKFCFEMYVAYSSNSNVHC